MKHRLKNIANRIVPLDDGTRPRPGEVVEAEMTQRNCYLVKNKFFEDLGEVKKEAPKTVKKEEKGDAKSEFDKAESPSRKKTGDDRRYSEPRKSSRRGYSSERDR